MFGVHALCVVCVGVACVCEHMVCVCVVRGVYVGGCACMVYMCEVLCVCVRCGM